MGSRAPFTDVTNRPRCAKHIVTMVNEGIIAVALEGARQIHQRMANMATSFLIDPRAASAST
ncbi:hypothetical protein ACP70R_032169 [Stipagrostis hirtigluma subsp. patula]